MMQIPFHRAHITDDEINGVVDSLRKGWITMGEKTVEFEKEFAAYTGGKHAVAMNSCTASLHLALKVIGIKEGDEVIVPAMTFAATSETVLYFNAKPVFADVCPDTHLILPEEIEKKKTSKTRAIMPVHYAGQPADLEEIRSVSGGSIPIIEDAAHALPSYYRGKIIGSEGDIICFSFYATKTVTTGEGGMAVTANEDWAERMRRLRLHGISSDAWKRYTGAGTWKYDVTEVGYKYNTTDLNAALGLAQLMKADDMRWARERIADRYNRAFKEFDGILPYRIKDDRVTSWHLYPLRLDIDNLTISRDEFIEEMKSRGIATSVHFIPLHHFTYYRNFGMRAEDFPNAEWIFDRVVSLPIYPDMNEAEADYVIENVIDIVKKRRR